MSEDIQARFKHRYDGFTLDVDLVLPGKGVTAVFGPSGCGKTTLLRCMAGLTRADQGQLTVNGEVWQDDEHCRPTHQRPLGYVFQEASLFAHLNVRRNLQYGQARVQKTERRIELGSVVELLGIAHLLERMPQGLSGGERQRVAIARALMNSPKVLFADEPTGNLDIETGRQIMHVLEMLHDKGQTIVMVTHDRTIARQTDRVVVLAEGRLREVH